MIRPERVARNDLIDTNENRRNDMDILGDLEVSDKGADEDLNEEDYDPRTLEEMKERSEPQFYDPEDIPDLTLFEAKPCQVSKASKML